MYKKKVYKTCFLMPALVVYLIFFILPVIAGIGFSFTNWNSMKADISFVGLRNYIEIFNPRNSYLLAIKNTFIFTIFATIGKIGLGLLLALFFNRKCPTQPRLRGIYFMPFAISSLIIGIVFTSVLAPDGVLNAILSAIGLEGITRGWLTNKSTALSSVICVEIWKSIGLNMVIFLAGLQMIDRDYYEAAALDGAGKIALFRFITMPFLLPSITINLILNTIHGLKVFDIVMALTNGGPGNATQVINTFVFKTYGMGAYGLSNALSTFIFIVTTLIALAALKIIAPKEA